MTDSESFRNNIQNCFEHPSTRMGGQVLIIDISNLFVFCFLLFGPESFRD